MCERFGSMAALGQAADALTLACRQLCSDDIGDALRAIYNDTLSEPVPQHLLDQLSRLSGESPDAH